MSIIAKKKIVRNHTIKDSVEFLMEKHGFNVDNVDNVLEIGLGVWYELDLLERPEILHSTESKIISTTVHKPEDMKLYVLAKYGMVVYSLIYKQGDAFGKLLQSHDKFKRAVKYYSRDEEFDKWFALISKDFNRLFRKGKMHFDSPLVWEGNAKGAKDFLIYVDSNIRRRKPKKK